MWGKEFKLFVERKNDGVYHFAFSDVFMKIKAEPFNDESPFKLKFIDK